MIDSSSGLILLIVGAGAGFLLAVVGGRCTQVAKQFWKRCQLYTRERAALSDLEKAPIGIDEERITCALCWESRHPGLSWCFPWYRLCRKHQQQEEEVSMLSGCEGNRRGL